MDEMPKNLPSINVSDEDLKKIFQDMLEGEEIMQNWLVMLLDREIEEIMGTISNQKLATLGGDPFGEENLARLDKYLAILWKLKIAIKY